LDLCGNWLRNFLDFRLGVRILWYRDGVRNSRDVHESGAARTHPLAVELGIASHLRDAFLRRYLWCDVRGTWGSSSESATTPDPFSVPDAIAGSPVEEIARRKNSLKNYMLEQMS
jgi:hypothetical protein